jgi:hypothetical protein
MFYMRHFSIQSFEPTFILMERETQCDTQNILTMNFFSYAQAFSTLASGYWRVCFLVQEQRLFGFSV